MDIVMIVLRLLHIIAAVYWVGAGLLLVLFLYPTIREMGNAGYATMRHLYLNKGFSMSMPIASLTTTVAGVLLYIKVYSADWLTTPGGLTLTGGAIAGLLVFGHGASAMGPKSSKLEKLGAAIHTGGGTPTDEQSKEFREAAEDVQRHGRISLVLMVIALVGMISARYM